MTTIPSDIGAAVGEILARAVMRLMEERPVELTEDEPDDDDHVRPIAVRVEDMRRKAEAARYPIAEGKRWSGRVKRTYRGEVDMSKRAIGIALHSNGVTRKESSQRWHLTTAHWQATHERALWLHPHATYLIAANMLDVAPLHAISIESIGKGGSTPVSDAVIETTRECIRQIVTLQRSLGYPVTFIAPHRVGALAESRPSCPGRDIWANCGEWAAREFGLKVPPDEPLWHGCGVIPKEWHGEHWRGGEGLARMTAAG